MISYNAEAELPLTLLFEPLLMSVYLSRLVLFIFACCLCQPASSLDPQKLESIAKRTNGEDWYRFLGPTIDGKSKETGIIKDWSDQKLKIVWSRELEESYAIGSVSRGRMIQSDRVDDQCVTVCLNAETGEQIWKFKYKTDYSDLYGYNGGPRCSPVIDDDRVYIYGVEGMLHCLGMSDGKVKWKRDLNSDFGVIQNFFGVGSSPLIVGDMLIVMVGGSTKESQDVGEGQLDLVKANGSGTVAIDKTTGKTKYKLIDDMASYASMTAARIEGKMQCFSFGRAGLTMFDPEDGKVGFHFPWRAKKLESVNASTPVFDGNRVFISETYGPGSALLEIKSGKHKVLWSDEDRFREKSMQTHWNTAIIHEGYIYGSSGRHTHNAELRCVELATGKVMWSKPDLTRCSLMYIDGCLVSLGEDGRLMLLKANPEKFDLITGVSLAKDGDRLLKYPCWAAPIVSRGLMYVRGNDRLVCLDLIPTKKK